jgi:xanthine dehydrogenase YagS FAD-binding subunit
VKAFKLSNPNSLESALAVLADARTAKSPAKVLAGGQDLLTEMQEHLVEPERVVNLKSIGGLDALDTAGSKMKLGALVTLARLGEDPNVKEHARVLHEAALSIASAQIRSTGTVGGNLCQRPRCWYYRIEGAKCLKKGGTECLSYGGLNKYNAILGGGPSYIVHPSDLAPALVALDASIRIDRKGGSRTLELSRFFTLPDEGDILRENVLTDDEVVTEISFATPVAGSRSTYIKFKERGSYDFALASVALALSFDGDVVRSARAVLGGVAPIPWRSLTAEQALVGQKLSEASGRAAAEEALRAAEPLGQNAYKVPLTKALIVRAVRSLA